MSDAEAPKKPSLEELEELSTKPIRTMDELIILAYAVPELITLVRKHEAETTNPQRRTTMASKRLTNILKDEIRKNILAAIEKKHSIVKAVYNEFAMAVYYEFHGQYEDTLKNLPEGTYCHTAKLGIYVHEDDSKYDSYVLNRMMTIHFQIPLDLKLQIKKSMSGKGHQHMIEKSDAACSDK